MPVKIFFCYAHEDELLLNKLKAHLKPLQRMGLIDVWYDRDISAGTKWEEEINTHLNEANIILLLVSPDFMDSDYCYGIEMQRALERDQRGEARVIPIILRSVYWQDVLGNLQALPTDAKPIKSWSDLDEALYNVTEGIRNVLLQMTPPAIASLTILGEMRPEITSPYVVEKLALQYTLTGHEGSVLSVALSADGQTLVSGSDDKTIKVWNLSTGQELRTLTGHEGSVLSIALSANGQTLVSGYGSGIKVWNLSTGQEVRTLKGRGISSSVFTSVALSADGQTLVSGSDDKTIKVWNLSTGQELRTLTSLFKVPFTGPAGVRSIALSADGQTLVSIIGNRTIKVWNLSTGQKVRTLTGHTAGVRSIALSADGQTLASSSDDETIKVWNLSTDHEVRTLTGNKSVFTRIALSADGQTLVSGYGSGIKVWNLSTGQEVRTLKGHTASVLSIALSADGQTLVSGSRDQTIKVWRA